MLRHQTLICVAVILGMLGLATACAPPGAVMQPQPAESPASQPLQIETEAAVVAPPAESRAVQPLAESETRTRSPAPAVKNIIFFIGDGMGSAQRWLGAVMAYGPEGTLAMDQMEVRGVMTTYSSDSLVTDSAAAATSMASGIKAYNRAIGVDLEEEPVETIVEAAERHGLATGLVTTVYINHATPAAFAAHVPDRGQYNEIAAQMLEAGVDVLLGGGARYFLPEAEGGRREDGRNLIEEAQKVGYQVVQDVNELLAVQPARQRQVLGLFASAALAYELDRETTDEPSLAQMTAVALDILAKNKDGFFLMVEGGKIDWASHGNDAAATAWETIALDQAVEVALSFARTHPGTLVVVTADHETGGLGFGIGGEYFYDPALLRRVTASGEYIAGQLNEERTNIQEVLAELAGIEELTEEEVEQIKAAEGDFEPGNTIAAIIGRRAGIGWTTTGHTGILVPLTASGSGAERFRGQLDNTDIPKIMGELLGLDDFAPWK